VGRLGGLVCLVALLLVGWGPLLPAGAQDLAMPTRQFSLDRWLPFGSPSGGQYLLGHVALDRVGDLPSEPRGEFFFDRWLPIGVPGGGWYSLGHVALDRVDDLRSEPPAPADNRTPRLRFASAVSETEPPATVATGWRLLKLQARASSYLWGGTVSGETDLLDYGPPDRVDDGPGAASPRLLRVGLKGSWGGLDAAVRYESVSRGLEPIVGPTLKTDQEGSEAWLAARLGVLRLKASVGETWTNVADDAHQPRTTTTQGALALELTLPTASLVSVSVSRGNVVLCAPTESGGARRLAAHEVDSLVATLYHWGGPEWAMTLSTTYAVSAELGRLGPESAAVSHDLSASYQPIAALTIVPALSLGEQDPETGVGSRYQSASLTVTAAPLVGPLDLTLFGAWTRSHTTDGAYDGRTVNASASLVLNLRQSAPRTTLALQAGYSRDFDAASRLSGYEEVRGLVLLRIAAF
jgi:hypothetical protein